MVLLRGKKDADGILVDEVVLPPLSTQGAGFSGSPTFVLRMDLPVLGVSHSHPSGTFAISLRSESPLLKDHSDRRVSISVTQRYRRV